MVNLTVVLRAPSRSTVAPRTENNPECANSYYKIDKTSLDTTAPHSHIAGQRCYILISTTHRSNFWRHFETRNTYSRLNCCLYSNHCFQQVARVLNLHHNTPILVVNPSKTHYIYPYLLLILPDFVYPFQYSLICLIFNGITKTKLMK